MRPTLQYIEDKFDYYNHLCFDGLLPRPVFKLTQRPTKVGCTNIKLVQINGKYVKQVTLEFSIRYDLPESEYIDTIVHEMIHYYISINNMNDDSPHGTFFRSMMNDISEKYGIRITITYDEEEEALIARETDRNRYICVIEGEDDYKFAIVFRDKLFQYWEQIPRLPGVKHVRWYVSNRAIFERYPSRIRPCFFSLAPDKVQSYLHGALELENTGTIIRPIEIFT